MPCVRPGPTAAAVAGICNIRHIREPVGSKGQYPLILGDFYRACIFRLPAKPYDCLHPSSTTDCGFLSQTAHRVWSGTPWMWTCFRQTRRQPAAGGLRCRLTGSANGPVVGMVGNLTTSWKAHDLFMQAQPDHIGLHSREPVCGFLVVAGISARIGNTVGDGCSVKEPGSGTAVVFSEMVVIFPP